MFLTHLYIHQKTHLYIHADPASAAASQANREEADTRSVFVGNVSFRRPFH